MIGECERAWGDGVWEMEKGRESSREYERETDSPRGGPELNMSQK